MSVTALPAAVQRDLDRMLANTAKNGRVDLWPASHDVKYVVESLARTNIDSIGAITWQSNGQAPMSDMLAAWYYLGLVTASQVVHTTSLADSQAEAAIAAYRAAQPATPSAEERAEMLAAFGPGETVVDVLTGRRVNL